MSACQRWLAPIGTFVTSQRTCYDAPHVLEIVMTPGAKDGQGPPVCAWTPDDSTLGEKSAHSSAEGENFFGEELVRTNRAGVPSSNKAARHDGKTRYARRHICCCAGWCVETKGGDTVFLYMLVVALGILGTTENATDRPVSARSAFQQLHVHSAHI